MPPKLDSKALFYHPAVRRAGLPALGVLAAVIATIVAATWKKELDERHVPHAFGETFDFARGSFADYIAYAERRLRAARPDAEDEVIANLAPFRLEPREGCVEDRGATFPNGIVLTHDLLETPYSMRHLGQYLADHCVLVYGMLLPGHGTRPGDLLDTDSSEWIAAERFAARELQREVDNVYLGGHGIGGTLAILEAATNADVDGLIVFAPALSPPRARAARYFEVLDGFIPAARWADVVPPFSDYTYDSRPWRSDDEVAALVKATQEALPQRPFEVPVLTVVSATDATIDVQAVLAYAAERVHPLSMTLVYGQNYLPEAVDWLRDFPDIADMGLSHRGLMVPPYDSEFGEAGNSRDCGHYFRRDRSDYERCLARDGTRLGEITRDNLAAGLVERSAYNPDFRGELSRQLDAFLFPVTGLQTRRSR